MFEVTKSLFARKELRNVNALTDEEPTFDAHVLSLKIVTPYIANKTVLDVGCWTGQFAKRILIKTKSVTGVDIEANAIKLAKKNCPKGSFYEGDARKLQFKKNTFDVVTFLDVIEHVPKGTELTCLKEIHRVLKPKGILILCTPFNHPLSVISDPMFWVFGHRHYSEKTLRDLLTKAGFTIPKVVTTGTFWRIIYFNVSMITKHIFRTRLEYPEFIKKKVLSDIEPGGFMSIHVVARKA